MRVQFRGNVGTYEYAQEIRRGQRIGGRKRDHGETLCTCEVRYWMLKQKHLELVLYMHSWKLFLTREFQPGMFFNLGHFLA